MWQLSNSLKVGSDISETIENLIEDLTKEQMIAIRKYGQELNPYTMMYMLIAVILPALGITFLMVLSSFSGILVPKSIFLVILFGLIAFQFFYISIVKSKRPTMDVSVGDIAYWPEGKCLCIFFGRTPASTDDKPVPASEVVIDGKTRVDVELLRRGKPDTRILVE